MNKKELYDSAKKYLLKERRIIYNRIIIMYNADTGNNLSVLSGCSSCIRDFENYKPVKDWVNV